MPARGGGNRNVSYSLKAFHEDLERIGPRLRRHYDSRRTFISLAQADGARKDVLRWVTHGPTGDIVDAYTTLLWATLCEAVSCLRIAVNEGKVLQLRAASERPAVGDGLETDASTPGAEKEKARRTEPSGL